MTARLSANRCVVVASALLGFVLAVPMLRAADNLPAVARPNVNAAVNLTDNGGTWTLDNGIVNITIDKKNGNLLSVIYRSPWSSSRCSPSLELAPTALV